MMSRRVYLDSSRVEIKRRSHSPSPKSLESIQKTPNVWYMVAEKIGFTIPKNTVSSPYDLVTNHMNSVIELAKVLSKQVPTPNLWKNILNRPQTIAGTKDLTDWMHARDILRCTECVGWGIGEKFPNISEIDPEEYLTEAQEVLPLLEIHKTKIAGLRELCLIGKELTSLPVQIVRHLTQLQKLYLSINNLPSLPCEMQNLTALEKLEVDQELEQSLPPNLKRLCEKPDRPNSGIS